MTAETPAPKTVEEIAAAASALIADARAAGLPAPFSINCHDYGTPTAVLYLFAYHIPDIWDALRQWADHYHADIDTHDGVTPGTVHATATFNRDGINWEISTVIHADPDDDQPGTRDQPDTWSQPDAGDYPDAA